jgi:uracil-DNA glycosylase family 4
LALGLTAVDRLLGKKHVMGQTRGKLIDYHNAKMLVTYHPAALFRNPNWKRGTWEDMKYLRRLLDESAENDNK